MLVDMGFFYCVGLKIDGYFSDRFAPAQTHLLLVQTVFY